MVTKAAGGLGRRQLLTQPDFFIPLPHDDFGSYALYAGLPRTEWGLALLCFPHSPIFPSQLPPCRLTETFSRVASLQVNTLINTVGPALRTHMICFRGSRSSLVRMRDVDPAEVPLRQAPYNPPQDVASNSGSLVQVAEQAHPLVQRCPSPNPMREHRNNRTHEEVVVGGGATPHG